MVLISNNIINIYTCRSCGKKFITEAISDGTTPFMMTCNNCFSDAESCFFRCRQDLEPDYVWYRPQTEEDFAKQFEYEMSVFVGRGMEKMFNKEEVIAANKQHVSKGGLLIGSVELKKKG